MCPLLCDRSNLVLDTPACFELSVVEMWGGLSQDTETCVVYLFLLYYKT